MLLIDFIALCLMAFFRAVVILITGRCCLRCEHCEYGELTGKQYCKADKRECEKHILRPHFKRRKLRDIINE